MFHSDNTDKYNHYNSPFLADPLFLEELDNISEKNYSKDDFLKFDTDSYFEPELKEEKISSPNNSSELNKNAATNEETKLVKDRSIFHISKTPKNTEKSNIIDNTNNGKNTNHINNTNLEKKRKRPKNFKDGKHDKFYPDNLSRKLKPRLFALIKNLLNSSMKKIRIKNGNIFSKRILYSKPFFLKIEQDIILNTNTEFNINLLKSKLKDIFSHKISKKIKKFKSNYNKNLIEKIYEENIQTKTISILERTLLECLEHFRGRKYYPELEGLEKEYENVINEIKSKNSKEYVDIFEDFISRFEVYYYNKKSKPKQNKENIENKK